VAKRGRRRGRRGDGSIIERDGKYLARYSLTEGGVRRRFAKTFPLRNDAEWWLSQARRHHATPDDPFLRDYLETWLRSKRGVRPSTHRQYAEHVNLHIVPVLGGYRLSELHRRHIEAFVDDRLRYISPSKNKRLSPATVGKILVTLRSALDEAVPRDLPDNPAAKVEAPKVERARVEAMTPTLAAALVATVRETWLGPIVRVLLGSGMRLGEAIALDQEDVHDGWVSLRKSKTTIRAVPLSDDAAAAILEAIRQAPRLGPREPVFYSPRTGDRLRASSVSHALPLALGRAGLPKLTPHKLRHGTATLMARGGVSMRDIAEQLGHANPSLTARTYAHVAPDRMRDNVRVLDEAVK
jgi:integrase